jgi:hypothetical protein
MQIRVEIKPVEANNHGSIPDTQAFVMSMSRFEPNKTKSRKPRKWKKKKSKKWRPGMDDDNVSAR